jgi:pimeloyl-ACP methyl ester carboxylesterase
MPIIHHTAPTGTHGAPARAAALLSAATKHDARRSSAPLRALVGALVGLAAGSSLFLLGAAACLALFPAYLVAELLFAVHFFRRRARLSALPPGGIAHEPASALRDGDLAFERFLVAAAKMSALDADAGKRHVEALINRWCGGDSDNADANKLVTRGNAAEMLTYGFYYRSCAQMAAAGFPSAGDEMVSRLERAMKRQFAPGPANPAITLMAHLREPVRAHWRPAAFYLGTEVVALSKHWALLASGWMCAPGPHGATVYTFGDVSAKSSSEQTPILFCHGVGLGLAPYVPMVLRLAATGRPVIAVEFKHLAMRWTRRVPTVEEAVAELAATLASFGISRCDAVGHSFGTLFLSRFSQVHPRLVRTLALMDPVCCTMWTGDLVGSFVVKPHACRNGLVTWMISRDLHAAAAVSRRFFWTHYNMWGGAAPQDQDNSSIRTLLAVGGRDNLVSAQHVAATVATGEDAAGNRTTMLHHPDREHADVVFHPAWQARVVDEAVAQMVAADCDDLLEELRAAVSVSVSVAPAATATATVKAAWALPPAGPARRCSMPPASAAAVCADGDDAAMMALPMQRSYTISAGVAVEPTSAWPPRGCHARSDSAGSSAHSSCDLGSFASLAEEEEERVSPSPSPSPPPAEELLAAHERRQQLKAAASAFVPQDAVLAAMSMDMRALCA